jgi:hypothetical protein
LIRLDVEMRIGVRLRWCSTATGWVSCCPSKFGLRLASRLTKELGLTEATLGLELKLCIQQCFEKATINFQNLQGS